jgi:hypothetical protein
MGHIMDSKFFQGSGDSFRTGGTQMHSPQNRGKPLLAGYIQDIMQRIDHTRMGTAQYHYQPFLRFKKQGLIIQQRIRFLSQGILKERSADIFVIREGGTRCKWTIWKKCEGVKVGRCEGRERIADLRFEKREDGSRIRNYELRITNYKRMVISDRLSVKKKLGGGGKKL